MLWILALDENVWIYAAKLQDEREQRDETCFRLLINISANGHFLSSTNGLYVRWSRQLDSLKTQGAPTISQITKLFGNLIRSRTRWVTDSPLDDQDHQRVLDQHGEGDLEVTISAAGAPEHFVSKNLVSTDSPLRRDLMEWQIPERYGFVFSHPSEVLTMWES